MRLARLARLLVLAPVIVVGAACGKPDKPAGAADPAPSSTTGTTGTTGSTASAPSSGAAARPAANPALAKLVVTADGQPIAMQRAFIKRVSPDQWRLQVGDLEGSCDELLSGVTNKHPGGTSFVASVARRLHPDGSDILDVTDFWSAGHPTDSVTSTVTIDGTGDRDSKVAITLGKIVDVDKTRRLEVAGAFTAIGCGDQPAPTVGLPKAPHPSTATLTIAGKRIAVASATRTGGAIVLTTGPRDCTPPTVPAQATIQHRGGQWELTGTWFAQPGTSTDNALGEEARTKDLKLTPGATGTSADGPTIALHLAGAGKLGDYPVQLDGAIEALDCPAAK